MKEYGISVFVVSLCVLFYFYYIRLPCAEIEYNTKGSQLGQDEWVIRHTKFKTKGYYVDIGARDGKSDSNTYLLDTVYQWDGLCIDLNLRNMDTRRCKQHRGLVSNKVEEVAFNQAGDTGLAGIHGLNSAHSEHSDVQGGAIHTEQTSITQTVFDEFAVPSYVDYLSLDVEGAEVMVLEGIDFDKHTFGIISVEHNNVETHRDAIRRFLVSKGYTHEATLEVDDIYIYPKKNGV